MYCCRLYFWPYLRFLYSSLYNLKYSPFLFVTYRIRAILMLLWLTQNTRYKGRSVFMREREIKREWWGNWTSPSWACSCLTFFLVFYTTAAWAFTYVGQISSQLWIERAWRDQIGQEVRTGLSQSRKPQAWMAAGAIPSSSFWLETLIVFVVRDLTSYSRMNLDK